MQLLIVQTRLCASNDSNGNPRRCSVLHVYRTPTDNRLTPGGDMVAQTSWRAVVDEEYHGDTAVRIAVRSAIGDDPRVVWIDNYQPQVTPAGYRHALKYAGVKVSPMTFAQGIVDALKAEDGSAAQ